MNPTILNFGGHMQGKVVCTVSEDKKKLITIGCDDLINLWNVSDMTQKRQIQLPYQDQQSITCIQYNQRNGTFIIGTDTGKVILFSQSNTSNKQLIYQSKTKSPIHNIKYSKSYRYLAIASGQQRGIIYDNVNNNFFLCDTNHTDQVTFINFSNNQQLIITLSKDSYTHIYHFQPESINKIQYIQKYQICHTKSIYQYINFWQRPSHQYHFTFAGSTTLQQIVLNNDLKPMYKIKVQVHQQKQILQICWLNQHILAVTVEDKLVLWNYTTKQKFQQVKNSSFWPITTDNIRLFCIQKSGSVYKWQSANVLNFQTQQAHKYIQRQNNPLPIPTYSMNQQIIQQPKLSKPKKHKKKIQQSIAEILVQTPPQTGLQSYYQWHLDARFFFYNQHGCIIKRVDGDQQTLQLQYHDRFRIRRIKFQSRGHFYYFALTQNCFLYSGITHTYFEMQAYKRIRRQDGTSNKQPYLIKWDYKMENIQGVAIGNTWVAIVGRQEIRIFDYHGNQLHCISFDRIFLAVSAYQDMLIVAYNSSIPSLKCQQFQLKIYKITSQVWSLQKKQKMPIKCEYELKWLGFSQEGCIFMQDTSQTIHMFNWQNNQWVNVFQIDCSKYKIFIQHIEKYEIYGFKIQQKQGQPTGPTVLPRSLPRKIPFQLRNRYINGLNDEQNKKLQQIYINKLSIQHEKFRSKRWYKHKYSRRQDNYMFKYSQKIKNQQEINQSMVRLDLFIIDQIKKLLNYLPNRLNQTQFNQIKYQLLALCTQMMYFKESVGKIRQILGLGNPLANYMEVYEHFNKVTSRKYNKISRLQAMIDMGWIQRFQN